MACLHYAHGQRQHPAPHSTRTSTGTQHPASTGTMSPPRAQPASQHPAVAPCLHHMHSQITPPASSQHPHQHRHQQPVSTTCTASSQHQHQHRHPAPSTSTSNLSPPRAQPAHSTSVHSQLTAPAPAPGTSTSNLSRKRARATRCYLK